ncbi:hypothetical protein [Dermabacter hominis]|uniref:hypothetical protein n=1 Tax=Dermabacter hominis TaxID=36740 RepID=UPI000773E0A5|nr:hypothetical protein [Dermabacter hominis]
MTKTIRMTRSLSTVAAVGVLAFGLAGCGAFSLTKEDESDTKETTTASEAKEDSTNEEDSTTEEDSANEEDSKSDESSPSASDEASDGDNGAVTGDDIQSSIHGTPVELDETPFTEEDKKKGAQVVADALTSSFDKKFEDACSDMVMRNGNAYERMDTDEVRELCAAQSERLLSSQGVTDEQAEQIKQLITPDIIEIQPNGDGTAKVLIQGQEFGVSLVKVKGAGPLLDLRNMPS